MNRYVSTAYFKLEANEETFFVLLSLNCTKFIRKEKNGHATINNGFVAVPFRDLSP